VFRHPLEGQCQAADILETSFENVTKCRYLWTNITNLIPYPLPVSSEFLVFQLRVETREHENMQNYVAHRFALVRMLVSRIIARYYDA
jgi:hypothetical protein